MQTKIVPRLANPKEFPDFFGAMSVGLDTVFENATTIAKQAAILTEDKAYRGQEILNTVADEEAAKFLILLDAVCCPKGRLTQQLSFVYSHLAKGIYANAYSWSCNTLGELRGYVKGECEELSLDGTGEGQSWICENEIIQQRENKIYVDLHHWEDTGYHWNSPKRMEDLGLITAAFGESRVMSIMRILHQIGITGPKALEVVSSFWRDVIIDDNFDWFTLEMKNHEILVEMSRLGLLKVNLDDSVCRSVRKQWFYPLYLFNLSWPTGGNSRKKLQQMIEEEKKDWLESMI